MVMQNSGEMRRENVDSCICRPDDRPDIPAERITDALPVFDRLARQGVVYPCLS
jgi:hypothetical protein